jgi:tetratricopeptide (TPR) repeat protein
MCALRADSLLTPARGLRQLTRRRPKTALAVVGAAGILFGGYLLWIKPYFAGREAYRAAQRAVEQDRLDDARRHVEECLHVWPADTDVHLLAIRVARLRGDVQSARKHLGKCDRAVQGKRNDRLQLAWCLYWAQTENLGEVEPGLIRRLDEHDPSSSLIMEALALGYIREYRFKDASGCLNKWLEQEPANVRALYWRGTVWESREDYREAAQDYQQVLRLVPDHLKARIRLVELLLADRNAPEAARHLKILQENHGDADRVALLLVRCLSLQGKRMEAKGILEAFLASHPCDPTALYERGQLEGEPVSQERYLRQALKHKPAYLEAHFALYRCLQAQQRRQEAAEEFERYQAIRADIALLKNVQDKLNAQPRDPDLLRQAGELMVKTGNEKMGRHLLARARNARRSWEGSKRLPFEP